MAAIFITAFILDVLDYLFSSSTIIIVIILFVVILLAIMFRLVWNEWNSPLPGKHESSRRDPMGTHGRTTYKTSSTPDGLMRVLEDHRKEIDALKTRVWNLERRLNAQTLSTGGGVAQQSRTELDKSGTGAWVDDRQGRTDDSHGRRYGGDDYGSQYQGFTNAESETEELCRMYNEAVNDSSKRNKFRDRYRITRISTTNVDERRRDPKAYPIFETSSNGEFYVVKIHKQGRPVFAAVPQFDLEINDLGYTPGAAGQVFKCHGYEPGGIYSPVRVIRPAQFLESGSSWTLDVPGELEVVRVSR